MVANKPVLLYILTNKQKSMKNYTIILLVSVIIFNIPVIAQENDDPVSIGTYKKLYSNILNEERTLLVNLPRGYDETKISYPVLYILYGGQVEGYFAEAVHIVDRLSVGSVIPDMIIIGIENVDRYRDCLPVDRNGEAGGADKFLRFFKEELIPYVNEKYRTKDFKILCGPQAGATFSVYALIEEPALFNANIITNPFYNSSIREYLLTESSDFFRQDQNLKNFLFISTYPHFDSKEMLEYLQKFRLIVENGRQNDFALIINTEEEDEDDVVSPMGLRKGLKEYFKEYKFPGETKIKGLEDLKEYYHILSQQYGYEVDIPEFTLVRQGDKLEESNNLEEAKIVFEYIVEKYPHDLNSYARLAELHRRWGNYDLAVQYYEHFLERERMPFIEGRLNSLKEYLNSPCFTSKMALDVSSLESVLLKTDEILANPDKFWETDGAYNLAKKWHDINKISVDTLDYYSTWIEHLEEINDLTEVQRLNHSSFRLMKEIMDRKGIFDERALQHICSFLPENDVNLNTTVYLTGHTLAWAFMTHSNVVINVLHSHYRDKNADYFMNTIVHEVFHIGYGKNRAFRTEKELENSGIYDILDTFHNEGMAVYTAYKAQKFFPAPYEEDYVLLENPQEVQGLLKLLNGFFSEAKSLSEDELRTQSWDIGIMKRGYYVVGAFMAKTIDEQLGREALIETIKKGPLSFVSTYNQLVDPEMQVYEF